MKSGPLPGGTMHLSAPDTFSLAPNFAASMDGRGAAELTLTSGGTTVTNSLHIGAG
jgi:hypothetical protein